MSRPSRHRRIPGCDRAAAAERGDASADYGMSRVGRANEALYQRFGDEVVVVGKPRPRGGLRHGDYEHGGALWVEQDWREKLHADVARVYLVNGVGTG